METTTNTTQITETTESTTVQSITTHFLTFLMFAEYMGYVSEFIEDVDKWIDGTEPEEHIKCFLRVEAENILSQMQSDMKTSDLRTWWNEFYPIVLYKADEMLNKNKEVTKKVEITIV